MKKSEIMSKNYIALSSLSMDLKRVALGYHRGSFKMGEKFLDEALKRKSEVDQKLLKSYLKNILSNLEGLRMKNNEDIAEDALLYSILLQNATLKMS